jgi:hypothetical protein
MSLLNRKASKQQQATDWLTTAVKAAAVGVAARGAGKATKKGAKKGAKKAAKRGGKSLGRRLAPIAAIGGLIVVAKRLRSSKDSGAEAWTPANGSPTPVAPPEPATAPTPPSG